MRSEFPIAMDEGTGDQVLFLVYWLAYCASKQEKVTLAIRRQGSRATIRLSQPFMGCFPRNLERICLFTGGGEMTADPVLAVFMWYWSMPENGTTICKQLMSSSGYQSIQ